MFVSLRPGSLAQPAFRYNSSMPMPRQALVYLVDYMAWADQTVLNACSALTADDLNRDFGISHSSILGTLCHMFIAEHDWLIRLRESILSPDVEPAPELFYADPPGGSDLAALSQHWPALSKGLSDFVDVASEANLDGDFFAMGFRIQRWKLILHVVNHASIHRGQVVGMIRQLGKQPPGNDIFIEYHVTQL
jgi:uncharacterized damage-inducible protein DinB